MDRMELDRVESNQPAPGPRSATNDDGSRQMTLQRALSVQELRATRQAMLHRHASVLSTLEKISQSNRSSTESLVDTSAAAALAASRFYRTESLDSITKKPSPELQMDPLNLTAKHELMMDRFHLRRMPTVRAMSTSSTLGNGLPTSRRNSLDASTHFSSHQRSLNHVTPQDTQSHHTTEAQNRINSGGDLVTTLEFGTTLHRRRQWVLSACSPTSLRTRIRLVLLVAVFALQAIYMPFSVVYFRPNDHRFFAIDVVVDAIYCLNIVALLNTATHNSRGILVTTRRAIWRQYRSGGFVRDLFAALPLELALLPAPAYTWWRWVMRAVQLLLRFVSLRDHIIAFFKLLSKDAIRTDKSIFAWLLYSKYSHLVRILGIVTFIMVLAHYIACIWSWLEPSVDTTHLEDPVRFHTQSLYAALQLLQGQGVTAITSAQALFGSAAVLLGSIVLAVIFGHVAVLVANFQANATTYQRKMERVFAIMSKLQLPHPIRERVHQYYEYLNAEYESLDGEIVKFAKDLSHTLELEVVLFKYMDVVMHVPHWRECSPDFQKQLVLHLNVRVYLPDDFIMRRGEVGAECYILNRGTCKLGVYDTGLSEPCTPPLEDPSRSTVDGGVDQRRSPSRSPLKVVAAMPFAKLAPAFASAGGASGRGAQSRYSIADAAQSEHDGGSPYSYSLELKRGQCVGEMALLANYERSSNLRAATYVEVCVLEREAFQTVLTRYPRDRELVITSIVQHTMTHSAEQRAPCALMNMVREVDATASLADGIELVVEAMNPMQSDPSIVFGLTEQITSRMRRSVASRLESTASTARSSRDLGPSGREHINSTESTGVHVHADLLHTLEEIRDRLTRIETQHQQFERVLMRDRSQSTLNLAASPEKHIKTPTMTRTPSFSAHAASIPTRTPTPTPSFSGQYIPTPRMRRQRSREASPTSTMDPRLSRPYHESPGAVTPAVVPGDDGDAKHLAPRQFFKELVDTLWTRSAPDTPVGRSSVTPCADELFKPKRMVDSNRQTHKRRRDSLRRRLST